MLYALKVWLMSHVNLVAVAAAVMKIASQLVTLIVLTVANMLPPPPAPLSIDERFGYWMEAYCSEQQMLRCSEPNPIMFHSPTLKITVRK